jgi:lipoate-protein ligase B
MRAIRVLITLAARGSKPFPGIGPGTCVRELLVADLGTVAYTEALRIQRALVELRARDGISDVLMLLEHPHVFTFGRRAQRDGTRGPDGYEWHYVERGGLGTYHGPGQLVGYPIVRLGGLGDVKPHILRIEEAIIRALRGFGIEARRKETAPNGKGHTGVWVAPGGAPAAPLIDDARAPREAMRKVASIGVAVEGWVAFHGFALNVDPDMGMFRKIEPCGLPPQALVSMAELLGRRVSTGEVIAPVAEAFSDVMDAERVDIGTGGLEARMQESDGAAPEAT